MTESKHIFNIPSGYLIDVETGSAIDELVSPSGDWLEVQSTGTMNLNIRDTIKMDNGSTILATITGRSVPNEVAGPKMEQGLTVTGDEMYFVLPLLMETNSEKYHRVNDTVFLGKMDELTMPSEKSGMIKYNVY